MSESADGFWSRVPGWVFPVVILGGSLLYGVGSVLWYRNVTSGSNQPSRTETCSLGSWDAAAFRALIDRVGRDGGRGGGGCGEAQAPGDCFESVLKGRIDSVQQVAGPDMIGRMMALHAVMRANKAVLLSQTTLPPLATRRIIGSGPGGALTQAEKAPTIQRAERFVYALDAREVGLPGPALLGGRRQAWDTGRSAAPSGLYALAEVTVVLSDPALRHPDDASNGAVREEIAYVEAAWSHRSSDAGSYRRVSLPSDSVHQLTSLCPRRPGWLDTPAVKVPVSDRPRGMGELMRWSEEMMRRGRSVPPP